MPVGDPVSGLNGKAYYGSTPTEIEITRWTFKRSTGTIDVTDSSNSTAGYRSKIANGFVEGAGTIEGLVKLGVAQPTFGTEVTLKLSTNTARYWSGSAIITDMEESLEVAGSNASSVSFSFETTGTWTLTDGTT